MMPIEKQVVSLELAKRLKELGCKQKSLFWWIQFANGYTEEHFDYKKNLHWEIRYNKNALYNFPEKISAFTCAELGEMLPKSIKHPKFEKEVGVLTILHPHSWWVGYSREGLAVFPQEVVSDTEANARAKMLIYLLENSLMGKERG